MKERFAWICIVLCCVASAAFAYLPPQDTKNGVTLRIEGFDETQKTKELEVRKVPADEPLPFTVTLRNSRKETVKGTVSVWLNDDWEIVGNDTAKLEVAAETTAKVKFTARAKERVLSALYPIHARFELKTGDTTEDLHPVAIFRAQKPKSNEGEVPTNRIIVCKNGVLRLDNRALPRRVYAQLGTNLLDFGWSFTGSDEKTGTHNSYASMTCENITRSGLGVHPPWRTGWGNTWCDYKIRLGKTEPISLVFHTAQRTPGPTEGKSDGVDFRVFAAKQGEPVKPIFQRFSDSKTWEAAKVDLSEFKGETITLRLWTGPGPKHNTTCDGSFWGDPAVIVGEPVKEPTEEEWIARENQARQNAQYALYTLRRVPRKETRNFISFGLTHEGEQFGVGIELGKQGLMDGVIAIVDDRRESLAYRGFNVEVSRQRIGAGADGNGLRVIKVTPFHKSDTTWYITHLVRFPDGSELPLRAILSSGGYFIRVTWDMPGVERNKRGEPRYTNLALGPANEPVWRAYAGFGSVFEDPEDFSIGAGGFSLCTRHVGGDYRNGISLLQATRIFPDRVVCRKDKNIFSLEAHGDNTFTFIPSAKGAFAAARIFASISGYKAGKGVAGLIGKQCLDQWGGDYGKAASGLALAGRYGLHDSVFVKHVWQRWGYDYRLPEIFPPMGSMSDFQRMRNVAKQLGILFVPHDNYIDFYPDAEGYTYDKMLFNEDGTPQRAWYNEGRRALSYRWKPHGFMPELRANMKQMRASFRPDGLFIDVFSAIAPMDYYDRDGAYYSKSRTVEAWGEAFDTCRQILNSKGPMISEAGTDALIGHLDAGESDHMMPSRLAKGYANAERTPWHDMVTHGKMVLFAGGLGPRYSEPGWQMGGDNELHGYGSDDYLSNTVIGGRNPMSDGPFSRRAVMTYWLLHGVCARLGRETFERHEFGETIQQQHTVFGKECEVWTNRGSNYVWKVEGYELPQYGFYVKTPTARAAVFMQDGQRAAFAQGEVSFFADARPPYGTESAAVSEVKNARYLGDGTFETTFHWNFLRKRLTEFVPFIHIQDANNKEAKERILFQPNVTIPKERLVSGGECDVVSQITIPADFPTGDYEILYGMFALKTDGRRMRIKGIDDGNGRVRGGILHVEKKDGKFVSGEFRPAQNDLETKARLALLGLNTQGKMINFGPITTDGAFKLRCPKGKLFSKEREWRLIPLPNSRGFRAELDLEKLGAAGWHVSAIRSMPLRTSDPNIEKIEWKQDGNRLLLQCEGTAFAYRIIFK